MRAIQNYRYIYIYLENNATSSPLLLQLHLFGGGQMGCFFWVKSLKNINQICVFSPTSNSPRSNYTV